MAAALLALVPSGTAMPKPCNAPVNVHLGNGNCHASDGDGCSGVTIDLGNDNCWGAKGQDGCTGPTVNVGNGNCKGGNG